MGFRVYFLLVLASAIIFTVDSAEGKTWTVRQDGSGDTTEIENAINSASDGDSIDVGPGTFQVQTYISKELTIYGSGMDSTSINCYSDTSSYVFRINTNNVVLSDFTINDVTNCRSFYVQSGAQDVEIKNIKMHNVYSETIYLESGTKTTLKNSIIGVQGASISSNGLYIWGSENIIDNNVFYGNSIVIYGSNNQIKNNEISHTSDWSIYLSGSNNLLSGNTVSDSPENNDDEGGSQYTAFDYLVGTRADQEIQFDWTEGSFYGGQDVDYFGVVWEANFYVNGDGGGGNGSGGGGQDVVEFDMYADDGYRITIDGDVWQDRLDCYGGQSNYYGEWMDEGSHTIKIEMLECTGSARAILNWYSEQNEPLAFQGKYYEHSPPIDEDTNDFKSIYLGNSQNTVDETNYFESSKFIMYYQQDGKSLSGLDLGSKKVSNYDAKIYISESTNIVIEDLYFNYPSFVEVHSSTSVTVRNCDFINGYVQLSGNSNRVELNTFTASPTSAGSNSREIYVAGDENTIGQNSVNNGMDIHGNFNHIHNNTVDMGVGHGIYVPGDGNKIAYNEVKNASSYGIYVGGHSNMIDGNRVITSLDYALYIGSTTGTTVTERNLLKGSCVVLYSDLIKIKENKKVIENCDYSDLSGSIWNLDYYVSLRNSAWVSIDSLTYENIDKSKGIYVYESNNISINSVRITSKERGSYDAISIENSEYISVSNSQFGDLNSGINSYYNVYLDFESNTLTNCDYGITDVGSGDISIEGNTFRNSAFGIDLTNSVFFTVEDNELRNDRIREMLGFGVGVFISNSIHGSVVNNDISGFDLAGIIYYTVSYLETENNKIYDNGVGVDLYDISPRVYLSIHNNDIYDNQQYGVYSDSPVDARFNWWGDPSGPYQRCESQEGCEGNVNTEGKGNPVNSNVDASEPLYASGQGFTIVNSIQAIAYEYKFPIILILIVGIVAVVAWRRGWFEDWGGNSFAPVNTYPMAPAVVEKTAAPTKSTVKKKVVSSITIKCTNCSEEIKVDKKSGPQKITCSKCGTSGEIEL